MVNSSAAAQSSPTLNPAGGAGGAFVPPEVEVPALPVMRHHPLRRRQHATSWSTLLKLRWVGLFIVPCFDCCIEAVFRKRIVPAFQDICRGSKSCDGIPLEKWVVCRKNPAVIRFAGVVAFHFIRTKLRS